MGIVNSRFSEFYGYGWARTILKMFHLQRSSRGICRYFSIDRKRVQGFTSIEYNSISIVHLYLLTGIAIVLVPHLFWPGSLMFYKKDEAGLSMAF